MSYLLDTDICIYWLKGREVVRQNVLARSWSTLAICVITVGELYYGAYNSQKVEKNLERAKQFVSSMRVLPLEITALDTYGRLKSQLRRAGEPLADLDLLIASIAIANNRILVTNNLRHYERISDLQLQNWTV
ncbi:MAG: type II toxin-antitoxin system VapC family toxin [Synechococcales bacterium]|nr:type II toxin-antitoxin system VapC family toxin [Synechococcales bacterium]